MSAPVGVLGGGSWGTSIARLLGENGCDVLQWVRNETVRREINTDHRNRKYLGELPIPTSVRATGDMAAIAAGCELIFVAIPMKGLRKVAFELGDSIGGDRMLISCTKGIEVETHGRPTEILKQETCCKKVGVLSGPNLAKEIMQGKPCATVVASGFDEVTQKATAAIMGPRFRVYTSRDVVGVELAGALKNIYALASGVCAGLDFGSNAQAALITRGLFEMTRYAVRCGANVLTLSGLAGVGDMMATCSSSLSRNHQVGARLGKGEALEAIIESMVQTAEGVNTTRAIHKHATAIGCEMPIAEAVHGVLFGGLPPRDAVHQLMGRPSQAEHEGLAVSASR